MTDEDVGAGLDRAATEINGVVGQVVDLAASLRSQQRWPAQIMAMQADDHLVGERARIAHLPQVLLQIAFVDEAGFSGSADLESAAEEVVGIFGALRYRIALESPSVLCRAPADCLADP